MDRGTGQTLAMTRLTSRDPADDTCSLTRGLCLIKTSLHFSRFSPVPVSILLTSAGPNKHTNSITGCSWYLPTYIPNRVGSIHQIKIKSHQVSEVLPPRSGIVCPFSPVLNDVLRMNTFFKHFLLLSSCFIFARNNLSLGKQEDITIPSRGETIQMYGYE